MKFPAPKYRLLLALSLICFRANRSGVRIRVRSNNPASHRSISSRACVTLHTTEAPVSAGDFIFLVPFCTHLLSTRRPCKVNVCLSFHQDAARNRLIFWPPVPRVPCELARRCPEAEGTEQTDEVSAYFGNDERRTLNELPTRMAMAQQFVFHLLLALYLRWLNQDWNISPVAFAVEAKGSFAKTPSVIDGEQWTRCADFARSSILIPAFPAMPAHPFKL